MGQGDRRAVLVGCKEIGNVLGVAPRRVGRLAAAGAPIRITGAGRGRRFVAELGAIERWLASSNIFDHLPASSSI